MFDNYHCILEFCLAKTAQTMQRSIYLFIYLFIFDWLIDWLIDWFNNLNTFNKEQLIYLWVVFGFAIYWWKQRYKWIGHFEDE